MTEEEANEYIASKTIAAGISPEEALDELNKELRPNGWEIRTVKRIGGAWFLDVKPSTGNATPSTGNTPIKGWGPTNNITPNTVSGGMNCKKCNAYNQYAAPNQADGTFICYSCRS